MDRREGSGKLRSTGCEERERECSDGVVESLGRVRITVRNWYRFSLERTTVTCVARQIPVKTATE